MSAEQWSGFVASGADRPCACDGDEEEAYARDLLDTLKFLGLPVMILLAVLVLAWRLSP